MARSGIEHTTSRSRGERSNHWATAAVYCGIQKINTCATSRCDRKNSINAFARVVFSIFILSIFSIILTLKVSLINTVMQNIIFYYQTTRLSRVLAKTP